MPSSYTPKKGSPTPKRDERRRILRDRRRASLIGVTDWTINQTWPYRVPGRNPQHP